MKIIKTILLLTVNVALSSALLRNLKNGNPKTCASACPVCVQCDTKKGICSVPLTGTTCQFNSLNGVCSSQGICDISTNVPTVPLQKCQTNFCPSGGSCTIMYLNDGSDCTTAGAPFHSFCINDGCRVVVEALTKTLPAYNIGCNGLPDNMLCDTNLNVLDGETCQNGICKFPNGQYNGVLP